ncbi:MAG: bifunctional phosphoribosylaminoimidazolecarboxamide formyltransferase/IMP cyclohydrolase [Gammaproteobacteria bacterium]|nr:bifunctional phosphoribosylaminoimidazolecarboxamide formyltransferase/IMP cyclohydrolase [Gammaproteobacteria bacterium]
MPKALISVTDKTGAVELAHTLTNHGYDVLSTGGTGRLLKENGIHVVEIAQFTGSPEMLGGRVKTLHPRVFGGILGRPDLDDEEFRTHGLEQISIVVVNLYEFSKSIREAGTTPTEAMEQIDIGGVSLIRAAAKNREHVLVVVDPNDYEDVSERISADQIDAEFRASMAAKAFRHTAAYDAEIARYLSANEKFPERLTLTYERDAVMRYGENPHQDAAYYLDASRHGALEQLQGKALSYNNIADTDAALQCLQGLTEPACAIVKHANPCGLAIGTSLLDAYMKAFRTDPTSAFGGIIAFNQELDAATIEHILDNQFAEVIAAPNIDAKVQYVAKRKKALRLITLSKDQSSNTGLSVNTVANGALVQDVDSFELSIAEWSILTDRAPSPVEERDLRFAWHVVKHVKSNAIVFAHDRTTTGIGAGQPNRVVSVRIAAMRMKEEGLGDSGCVMASDAFFPFRDSLDHAAEAGVTAVIQPAGSIRDDEVVAACNEHDMAMVATGIRHFRH